MSWHPSQLGQPPCQKRKVLFSKTSQWKIFSLPPLSSRSRHEMAIILSCDDLRAILEKVWQYIFYHILKPRFAVQCGTVKALPTLSFWHRPSRHLQLCQIISDLLDNQTLDTQELLNFFQTLTQTLYPSSLLKLEAFLCFSSELVGLHRGEITPQHWRQMGFACIWRMKPLHPRDTLSGIHFSSTLDKNGLHL